MCWTLLHLQCRRRACRLQLRGRMKVRGRGCRCCLVGRLQIFGWRTAGRRWFLAPFGLGGCGTLLRCEGIYPRCRASVSLLCYRASEVSYFLLTLRSIISLFFFSISCFKVSSGDASAGFSPSWEGLSSGLAASVDCHRREKYFDAVGCDSRAALELSSDEYNEEGTCWTWGVGFIAWETARLERNSCLWNMVTGCKTGQLRDGIR